MFEIKDFYLPNHVYCIVLTLSVTRVKFGIALKVRNVIHIVHVSLVRTGKTLML